MRAALLTGLLRIEVTDYGIGFLPPATSPARGNAAGGWGLWLVDQLTDRWGVDCSHSTRVWVEFDRIGGFTSNGALCLLSTRLTPRNHSRNRRGPLAAPSSVGYDR